MSTVIGDEDNYWVSATMANGVRIDQPKSGVQDLPGDTQVGPGVPKDLNELNANYPVIPRFDCGFGKCGMVTRCRDCGREPGRVPTITPGEAKRLLDEGIELGNQISERGKKMQMRYRDDSANVKQPVTATSPKSLDSSHKIPVNLCPASAIIAISLVIAQGHKKPGRTIYNWRTQPISYSGYLGAALRHILKSNDGSDFDKELSELAGVPVRHDWAAMSCLAIIEDARQAGTLVDDRPVKGGAEEFLESLMVKK